MKGLLLKEFYVWAKSRSWIIIFVLLYSLIMEFTSGYIFVLWLATISLVRTFADDEIGKWKDYSHALPYTPTQIVSSRYLFLLAETAMYSIFIAALVTNYIKSLDEYPFVEHFPYMSKDWTVISNMTLFFFIWLLGLALSMPMNYKFTGTARNIIGIIPFVLSAACCSIILIYTSIDPILPSVTVPKIFYNEKWVFVACASAALLALAASWLLCITFAGNSKNRIKKLKAIAAILIAALLAISAFSLTALYSNGYFEKKDYSTLYGEYYGQFETDDDSTIIRPYEKIEITDDQMECREEVLRLMNSLCMENNLEYNRREFKEKILGMGYYDTDFFVEEFYSVKDEKNTDCVTIRFYTSENTDKVTAVNISAEVGQFYIESTTTAELEKIESKFIIGMSQTELHETFNALEIVPKYISESYTDENQRTVYYKASYTVGDLDGNGGTYYDINVDVTDGAVSDIRIYYN